MPSHENYDFRSYIKDIFIEVPNYNYYHKPHNGTQSTKEKQEKRDHRFIGRAKLQASFLHILEKGDRNGAYLVTGYRGMGKTSLVNHVVYNYRKNAEKGKNGNNYEEISPVKISLAQAKLDEVDVLKHILKFVLQCIVEDRAKWRIPLLDYSTIFFAMIAFITALFFGGAGWFKAFAQNNDALSLSGLGFFLVFVALLFIVLSNSGKYIISILGAVDHHKRNHWYLLMLAFLLLGVAFLGFFLTRDHQTGGSLLDNIFCFCAGFWKKPVTWVVLFFCLPLMMALPHYVRSFPTLNMLYKLHKRANLLHERSNASVTIDGDGASVLKDISFSFSGRRSKTYQIAPAKEIEYELIEILRDYKTRKFIFIFDELDKVEMDVEFNKDEKFGESERTFLNDLRERKQIIIKVLSSLKHLLTEAEARFIFIAGREMFDASLADISDRQSALGSIFHHTIYVESFLKETRLINYAENVNSNSLVEEYLQHILLANIETPARKKESRGQLEKKRHLKNSPSNSPDEIRADRNEEMYSLLNRFYASNDDSELKGKPFLYCYWDFLEVIRSQSCVNSNPDEISLKTIFTIQNFITYLSYRSNGSPKKLIKLIEENFVKGESIFGKNSRMTKQWERRDTDYTILENDMHVVICNSNTELKDKVFLNFSFKQQYKLGLNAYLFFPFLSLQKNLLENYSDSVNVSTPYLMDSIIKFHPFAFSNHNLELLPEFLSTNKAPELRYFVQELIDFLGKNHIRETDSGLFKYKFFDRTHNEIAYISRISDEESAAFNFSMDESFAIKNHIAYKIQYLRNVYKDFKKTNNSSVESLLFLNDLLGDSQLFDEYYKDAIISLSDSLHDVPLPDRDTPIESFLIWMRIKLKLSMVFDKMRYYEMAVGHLGLAMDVALDYLHDRYLADPERDEVIDPKYRNVRTKLLHVVLHEGKEDSKGGAKQKRTRTPLYRELLQVTQHAILGSIYVQEKFAEGLTYAKMNDYLRQYSKIHEHNAFLEYQGRDMMMASFYLGLGTVLYFKNKTLPLNKTDKISKEKASIIGRKPITRRNEIEFLKKVEQEIGSTPVFRNSPNDGNPINDDLTFFPYIVPSYLELYKSFRTFEKKNSERNDFRFSFITYIAYKKSLATFLAVDWREGNPMVTDDKPPRLHTFDSFARKIGSEGDPRQLVLDGPFGLKSLIGKSIDVLRDYKNVHGSRKLISLANVITKLADHLLSLYDSRKSATVEHVFLAQIEAFESEKNFIVTDEAFIDRMVFNGSGDTKGEFVGCAWNSSKVSLTYIVNLYYLAGRLYSRAGRNVAYSFQLRKILLTIRTTGVLKRYALGHLQSLIRFLEQTIVNKILQLNSLANGSSDRAQIAAIKFFSKTQNISLAPDSRRTFYQNLASNPDSKEALVIFGEIKLFATKRQIAFNRSQQIAEGRSIPDFKSAVEGIDSLNLIGQFNSISHQAVRVMELNLQVKINKILLDEVLNYQLALSDNANTQTVTISIGGNYCWIDKLNSHSHGLDFESLTSPEEGDKFLFYHSLPDEERAAFIILVKYLAMSDKGHLSSQSKPDCDGECADHISQIEALKHYTELVTNSIFCLHQAVLTCNMYGINYIQGPAYLAGFYKKMGDWTKHLNLLRIVGRYVDGKEKGKRTCCEIKVFAIIKEMEDNLERLVGRPAIRNIDDYLSHYQNAIEQYNNSIQLHSEGPAYKHQLNNMIYLEDDYGDNLNHFGAAIERQMINSGKTRRHIEALEKEMSISRLFDPANYYADIKTKIQPKPTKTDPPKPHA
ncbi:hypothetical protein GCM10010967_18980 [Dyadobacter beijingensis]|uniref:AAA ATPase-like protein n=1 Tax=Dyadobacter beijingensis TaxID=365489 RepID=A0ABQ2HQ92_9BACT|nr:ATP-binding protein [Dyadobacter beijingensis]GGM86810.1 hypothetical protein GCM10010967_18980 [Dyadobacter beijingensis]